MSDKAFDIIIFQEKRRQKRTQVAANASDALWKFWEKSLETNEQLPVIHSVEQAKSPTPPNQGNTEKW
jgi:hypothetical protein